MKALIFNSGLGNRMGEFTQTQPKAMARLGNGETIFGRQLRLLAQHGITEFVVTTGPFAEQIVAETERPEFAALRFTFVPNEAYAETNYIYSMYLAREHLDDELLVLHGDLVFDSELAGRILTDPRPDLATYNQELPQPEKDFKVRVRDGALQQVAVTISGPGCYAFQPMYKLSRRALQVWLGQVVAFVEAGRVGGYAEDALNEVATEAAIELFSYSGHFVSEVDTLDDLESVAKEIRLFDFRQQPTVAETRGYVALGSVLERLGIRRPLLVCGSSYDSLELRDFVEALAIEPVRFGGFSPNPTYEQIADGVRTFREHACDGILTIGGGSAIDVGKCIKLFSALDPDRDYLAQEYRYSAVRHVVIPTTAGTGSEATHFSVVYVDGAKHSVAHDSMLPDHVFVEPTALATVPAYQKKSALLDALCQCIESVWSVKATAESRSHALAGLELIAESMFGYLKGDDPAAPLAIARAANLSGKAINLSQTTAPHAMSYVLTGRYGLAHGHAVALCLPPVWRHWTARLNTYTDLPRVARFRSAVEAICERLGAADAEDAITRLELLVEQLDLGRPGPPSQDDLAALVASVNEERLANSPLPLNGAELEAIYAEALGPVDESVAIARKQEFDTLVMFDAFCSRYRIDYFLAGRTLLDAIVLGERSRWSGPISVQMPRAHLTKLVRWRDQLPSGYALDDFQSNPDRTAASLRVVWTGDSTEPEFDRLPGIEVRPLERLSAAGPPLQSLRWAVLEQVHDGLVSGRLPRRFVKSNWIARFRQVAVRGGGRDATSLSYLDLGAHPDFSRSRFPASWFAPGRVEELDGQPFTVPSNAEDILLQLFGREYRSVRRMPARPDDVAAATGPVPASAAQISEGSGGQPDDRDAPPFVSVIMPVYNVEKYLPECLDSLCQQDADNYEIIAVNDGSPDNSLAILEEYADRFPGLITILTKENGGLSDARNHGIAHARGEYLSFVDSDDVVAPSMIRLMSEKARSSDADIVVCRHSEYWANSNRREKRWMNFINSYGHSVHERPELLVAAHPYAWNKIYRRQLFEDTGIRYPKGQAFEDSATTFNLMLEANKIELVDVELYAYRMDRPESITRTFDRKFYDIFKSFDSIRGYYTRRGCYEEFREEIHELMRRTSFARVNSLETCRDQAGVSHFLDAIYDYLDTNAPGWADNKYFRRQMRNPKYGQSAKYRAMRSRQAMKRYFANLWANQGDDLAAAGKYTTAELVRMLQLEELDILVELDTLCQERGLTYYLAEGTLLGAIRHQGFIPWDDDVDIAMPRPDYEKLIDILARGEAPGLRVFNERTYPRYHLTFTKVLSTKPSGFTNTNVTLPVEFQGPSVDIFPLDPGVAPRNRELERQVRRLRDMLLFKVDFMSRRTKRRKYKTYALSKVHSFGYLQRRIQRLYRIHEHNPDADQLVNYASSYPVDREKVPAASYGTPQRVPFEGLQLPVPSDWDLVLRTTYGAYQELPPPEQRVPRHRPRWRDPASSSS